MANPLNYASANAAPARSRFGIGCLIVLTLPFVALGAVVWLLDVEFNRFPVTVVVVNESAALIRDVVFAMYDKRASDQIVPLEYASPPKAQRPGRSAISILGTIVIIWIWVVGAMALLFLIAAFIIHG